MLQTISLRKKVILPLLAGAALLLLLATFFTSQNLERRFQEKTRLRAEVIANAIGYAAQSFKFGSELQRFVSSLGADRDVKRIVVVGGHPLRVVASTHNAVRGLPIDALPSAAVRAALMHVLAGKEEDGFDKEGSRNEGSHIEGSHNEGSHIEEYAGFHDDDIEGTRDFFFALHLILAQPNSTRSGLEHGAVVVVMDTQPLKNELWQSTREMLFAAFLSIAGAGMLVWLTLQRFVLAPLDTMAATLKQRALGNSAARSDIHSRDELGHLAVTVDALFDQLDQEEHARAEAESALHSHRRELHETNEILRSRNLALEDANQKLAASQSQLLQTGKMAAIGQLAAGVAHEINNPIGYINSNLRALDHYVSDILHALSAYETLENDALQNDALENASPLTQTLQELQTLKERLDLSFIRSDLPKLVHETREGSDRITTIVRSLRDFSRSDANEPWQMANIEKGLDASLNIAWNELKHKADVIKEYGGVGEIECMPSQLNQVFLNLMINAGHAMAERGNIWIRTERTPDRVFIEVADSGTGIAPDLIEKIFDPFFTTKPVGKGTGLGLAVSYGIIQKHGGEISVTSCLGMGTTFRIGLPLVHPETAPADKDATA